MTISKEYLGAGKKESPHARSAMLSMENTQTRFRRLRASQAECPLCGAAEVDYEFVIDRVAYSLCRACRLLFAHRTHLDPVPKPLSREEDSVVGALVPIVKRYAHASLGQALLVGPDGGGESSPIERKDASALDPQERYDTIFVLGALESSDDPFELLCKLKSHLSASGCLVLLTPSTTSIHARLSTTNWARLRSRSRFYFSPDTLQLLATQCGLGDFASFVDAHDLGSGPSEAVSNWFRSNAALICRPVKRTAGNLLSVIFPVFNEASTVQACLQQVLDKQIPGIDMEVIIVESNSTDGSRQIVEKYRADPRVHLILEDSPRGKGFAVRTGLRHASGDVVLFQDADLEYDVNDYDILVKPLFEFKRNFVLGSRHDARGAAWKIRHFSDQPGMSTVTNLAHLVLLRIFNTLYRQRLRDPFTMYKVFRRECLFGLTFECNRFDFDYEINIKLLRKGYQPIEIPVNYESRSFKDGKKVSFFGDPPTWIRAMLRMRRSKLYEALTP